MLKAIFLLVTEHIRQRPIRTGLAVLGVAIGVSAWLAIRLANVRAFWKLLGDHIPIIGTGGVETGRDVFEHVLCGASAVQIGTALVEEGVQVFERLERELTEYLQQKGYSSLKACRGKLKEL